jgi:YbgC/YbaW family acyl-CoA thioester hydrolase
MPVTDESAVFRKERLVHWGDCAPSGAVFYPNYYRWFDEAAWEFFSHIGLEIGELGKSYGLVGLPLMSCRAEFRRPCRLGDALTVDTAIAEMTDKTITLSFHILKASELAVRGEEVRFWGTRHPDEPSRLVKGAIPVEIAARLAALTAPAEENRRWPHG